MEEVFVTDYSGGGRIYRVEASGPDQSDVVFATPALDSTSNSHNARAIQCTDLDKDGWGELIIFLGRGYSPTNPVVSSLIPRPGLVILEADGKIP